MLLEQKDRPICPNCLKRPVRKNGVTKIGIQKWAKLCTTCHRIKYKTHPGQEYKRNKSNICEICGFIAKDPCQIDIHHIDGDHKNNKKENIQELCVNCHRLITRYKKQGMYKGKGE